MNYYEVLEISETATDKEIKKSYKQLVKKFHPDVFDGNKEIADKKIKQLNEAYEILSNPESRKKYDDSLQNSTIENIKSDLQNYVHNSEFEHSKPNIYHSYENTYYRRNYTTNYYGISRDDLRKEKSRIYNSSKKSDIQTKSKIIIIIIVCFLLISLLLISLLSLLKDLLNKQSTFTSTNTAKSENVNNHYVTLGMDFYNIRDMIGVPDRVETKQNGSYAYWGKSYIVFDKKDRVIDWKNNGDYFYTDTVTGKELRVLQELYNSIIEQNSDFDEF